MNRIYSILLLLFAVSISNAQVKILFDASKAESSGNADWIIDADIFNLSFVTSTPVAVLNPNYIGDANPSTSPTPPLSEIQPNTPENFWTGGISHWAIDCVKEGYFVETLPYNGKITFSDASNPQDLSHYSIYIIVEPNILYTLSEKDAIINFVKNGGSLCIIGNHSGSDRNSDGSDSVIALNDLMQTNSVTRNPFGITFDAIDFWQISNNILKTEATPLINGPKGTVTAVEWSGGTSMTINPSANKTIKGVAFRSGFSTSETNGVLAAYGEYGNGKFAFFGDSSIADDGTGDQNDNLYNGYSAEVNGNHQRLLMNTVIWLASPNLSSDNFKNNTIDFKIITNPVQKNEIKLQVNEIELDNFKFSIFDITGKEIATYTNLSSTYNEIITISIPEIPVGFYFCKINYNDRIATIKFIKE